MEGANSEDLRESWQVQVLNYLGNKFMVSEVVALSMLNKTVYEIPQTACLSVTSYHPLS